MWDRLALFIGFDLTKEQVNGVMKVAMRTGFIFHILFACGWLSFLGLSGFAKADETRGLNQQVAALRSDFARSQAQDKVDKLEEEIGGIDQELFLINTKLVELTALGQRADTLYGSRLATLQTRKEAVLRELAVARNQPALHPPGS